MLAGLQLERGHPTAKERGHALAVRAERPLAQPGQVEREAARLLDLVGADLPGRRLGGAEEDAPTVGQEGRPGDGRPLAQGLLASQVQQ